MGDIVFSFFNKFTNSQELITFLCSLFPLIELKGAIPIGTAGGLPLIESAIIAYCGSSLVCIPIFFLLIPIFNLLKKIGFIKKIILKLEGVFEEKAKKLAEKSNGEPQDKKRKMLIWGLFIFVAIPLPVTGVWTGTAIAVFLNMKFKDSFLPLVLGNLVAGILITLLTFILKDYVDLFITVLFIIALIMLIAFIVKLIKAKPNVENKE